MGLYDETTIVVTSDHGELLGEHNYFGHGFLLYQQLLYVPLIAKYPFEKHDGKIIYKTVQNTDIFAELLVQAGITVPSNIQGQLFSEVEHPIISEVKRKPYNEIKWSNRYNQDLIAIYSKQLPSLKLIRSSDGQKELFDIKSDPMELNNIFDSRKIQIIEEELDRYLYSLSKLKAIKQTLEAKKRLFALGYIK